MLRTCALLVVLLLAAPAMLVAQTLSVASSVTTETPAQAATASGAEVVAAPVVYHVAEQMPAFPGGTEAFYKFLKTKTKYPIEALQRDISGKVQVSFVVDEEGHILDPKVVRGLGAGLDEEALRLVRIMPWWTPGYIQGKAVRVAYTLPIVFKLVE